MYCMRVHIQCWPLSPDWSCSSGLNILLHVRISLISNIHSIWSRSKCDLDWWNSLDCHHTTTNVPKICQNLIILSSNGGNIFLDGVHSIAQWPGFICVSRNCLSTAALWFLDMINRNNYQTFAFLWLSEERNSHNFEQRHCQVTAKINEIFWMNVSSFNMSWHEFHKFYKRINNIQYILEIILSLLVILKHTVKYSSCFHFHPPFQWPLTACRKNTILKRFHLQQDRNDPP